MSLCQDVTEGRAERTRQHECGPEQDRARGLRREVEQRNDRERGRDQQVAPGVAEPGAVGQEVTSPGSKPWTRCCQKNRI